MANPVLVRLVRLAPIVVVSAALALWAGLSATPGHTAGETLGGFPQPTIANAAIIRSIHKDPRIAALVPTKYQKKGTLKVGISANYPPVEFVADDGKTFVGSELDVGLAISKILGLRFHFVSASFDSLIPSLQAGRYDIAMAGMGIIPDRVKVLSFVSDFEDEGAQTFMALTGTNVTITGLSSLCGLTVAVQTGGTEEIEATEQATKCQTAGNPMQLQSYPSQDNANLALLSGRAQVVFADNITLSYQTKLAPGKYKLFVVRPPAGTRAAIIGIALPKKSGLGAALHAAVNKLIADGTHKKLETNWGLQSHSPSHSYLITRPAQVDTHARLTALGRRTGK